MNPIYRTYDNLDQNNTNLKQPSNHNFNFNSGEASLSPSEDVIAIQSFEHKRKLLRENYLVVVDIWGAHCAPCKESMPKFAALAKKYSSPGVCLLVKEDFSDGYSQDIHAVPTFLFYVNGNGSPVHMIQGARMDEIEKVITLILNQKLK